MKRRPTTARGSQLPVNRRQFLSGLGVCVGLPLFETFMPRTVRAAALGGAAGPATTTTGAPLRMGFVCFPNGALQEPWWPTGSGADFQFGQTMEPLAAYKKHVQVVGGLDLLEATPGDDGAGDHARANASLLTGARARKTDGTDIHVGPSIDQLTAQHVGHATRFPSLELSCDNVRKAGRCDSGYSCAYLYNVSWQSATTPVAPEPNPRLVFERLFGVGGSEGQPAYLQRQARQKSLLDFVLDDARSLQTELGRRDNEKLDEYLTSLRDIEKRIERAEQFGDFPDPGVQAPDGIPDDYGQHMELMFDLLALAFQTDSTRVASLMLAGDGTNRSFSQIGIPEGHHYCTHHRNNPDLMDKVARIDRYYMEHFARFIGKLDTMRDPDGNSVLHNSMIVYGCGNADGNRHTHSSIPVVLAGSGGGTLNAGRYVRFNDAPVTNLYLSMADRMGVSGIPRIGDSTGRLAGI